MLTAASGLSGQYLSGQPCTPYTVSLPLTVGSEMPGPIPPPQETWPLPTSPQSTGTGTLAVWHEGDMSLPSLLSSVSENLPPWAHTGAAKGHSSGRRKASDAISQSPLQQGEAAWEGKSWVGKLPEKPALWRPVPAPRHPREALASVRPAPPRVPPP